MNTVATSAAAVQPVRTSKPRSKPRSKPARSIRLLVTLNEQGRNGVVSINVGQEATLYYLSYLPGTAWGTGFRLEKFLSEDVYDVNLNPAGHHACSCKGNLSHGHCKHVSGLEVLAKSGALAHARPTHPMPEPVAA